MKNTAKHVIFKGTVQGVGFRFTAMRIAQRYELTGYVKNLPSGEVEMLAQGHPEDIKDALQDISESFGANIRDKQITSQPVNPRYHSFEIAY